MSPRGVAQCGPSLEPADDVFVREVCSLPFFAGVVWQTDVVSRSFQSRTCHFFRMEWGDLRRRRVFVVIYEV